MQIEYFGHSSFLFTGGGGRTVLTDPYDETVGYRLPGRPAQVTLVSHDHWDHNHVAGVPGRTRVIVGAAQHVVSPDLTVQGVLAEHDMERGARFGWVTLFTWTMDGCRIGFLSDLGHALTERQRAALGPVDILLVPVGGHYTLDATGAATVVGQFPEARLVLPMHYQTAMLNREQFPIAGVEPFVERFRSVHRERSGWLEFNHLPQTQDIVVLSPSC